MSQSNLSTVIGIVSYQVMMKRFFRCLFQRAEERRIDAERTLAELENALRSMMRGNAVLVKRNKELESEIAEKRELIAALRHRLAGNGFHETI